MPDWRAVQQREVYIGPLRLEGGLRHEHERRVLDCFLLDQRVRRERRLRQRRHVRRWHVQNR